METTDDNFARQLRAALSTRSSPPPPKLRSHRHLLTFVLCVWGVFGLAASATLLAAHEYALPAPLPTDPQLALALHAEAPAAQATALHVLYVQCRCSQRIVENLVEHKQSLDTGDVNIINAAGMGHEVYAPWRFHRQPR